MNVNVHAATATRHVGAGIGSTAEAVRKNVLQNVGEGLSHGRKGAQVIFMPFASPSSHAAKRAFAAGRFGVAHTELSTSKLY